MGTYVPLGQQARVAKRVVAKASHGVLVGSGGPSLKGGYIVILEKIMETMGITRVSMWVAGVCKPTY